MSPDFGPRPDFNYHFYYTVFSAKGVHGSICIYQEASSGGLDLALLDDALETIFDCQCVVLNWKQITYNQFAGYHARHLEKNVAQNKADRTVLQLVPKEKPEGEN